MPTTIFLLALLAHPDSLPPVSRLYAAVDSFYGVQAQAQLLEFTESRKGEWLKYLPNAGITYTIDGHPKPALSFSSAVLYQAKKDRQQRQAKCLGILQSSRLAAGKAKAELAELLLQHGLLLEKIAARRKLLEIEKDLFLIREDMYNHREIPPSDYLSAKRTFFLQQEELDNLMRQLAALEMKIKVAAFVGR